MRWPRVKRAYRPRTSPRSSSNRATNKQRLYLTDQAEILDIEALASFAIDGLGAPRSGKNTASKVPTRKERGLNTWVG